ncbi:Rhodanese-like domain-containing protein 8 [Ranunculus cassubicifolius]
MRRQFGLLSIFPPTHLHLHTKPAIFPTIPAIFSHQNPLKSTVLSLHYRRTSKSISFSSFPPITVQSKEEEKSFIAVNFYVFVSIEDPQHLVSTHLSFLQYSGPSVDALAYLEWIKQDRRFSDILAQISPARNGHSFPRLKLRYKPSLVQLEGGISHLPLLDPAMRATSLTPSEWKNRLQVVNNVDGSSSHDHNQKVVLLDVRNGYEWDIGHFRGAQRPEVDCFRSTSFGLSESEPATSDPLAHIDKENTDILMYCTGGIRCDIYSSILRQKGFQNLFTLKGGVSHYLQKEGPFAWVGNLFVFDSRLSLPPSTYNPNTTINGENTRLLPEFNSSTFARCYICQSHLSELKHRNCANIDCNRLFLCCSKCQMDVRGCCCLDCTKARRLRPIQPTQDRYEKWHIYRDHNIQKESDQSSMEHSQV